VTEDIPDATELRDQLGITAFQEHQVSKAIQVTSELRDFREIQLIAGLEAQEDRSVRGSQEFPDSPVSRECKVKTDHQALEDRWENLVLGDPLGDPVLQDLREKWAKACTDLKEKRESQVHLDLKVFLAHNHNPLTLEKSSS
jgi:hypothetical protein